MSLPDCSGNQQHDFINNNTIINQLVASEIKFVKMKMANWKSKFHCLWTWGGNNFFN